MSWVTTRLLGFLSGGLGAALIAASVFGWVQTSRLTSAGDVITALRSEAALMVARIKADDGKLASRDQLIATQNTAVLAIQQAAEADRSSYLSRIAAADKVAKVYQTQAANIMARQLDTTNELERSRAALKLIQDMIGQDK